MTDFAQDVGVHRVTAARWVGQSASVPRVEQMVAIERATRGEIRVADWLTYSL